MVTKGLRISRCGLLAACGLGLNLVWCTLMGHTLGFLSSALGMEAWLNPRLFFLGGILVMAVAYLIAPRAIKRADGILRFVLPLLAAVGTACFGLSYHQTFFDPAALAVGGLFVAGVSYLWLVARYILLLGRTQGFSCTVASIAGGLMVKLPILIALSVLAGPEVQVTVAIVAPIASAFVFEACCALARKDSPVSALVGSEGLLPAHRGEEGGVAAEDPAHASGARMRGRTVFGVPALPRLARDPALGDRRAAYLLMVTSAVALAVIRSVSYLGMWGNTNASVSTMVPWLTGFVVPALCVAVFAYGLLILTTDCSLPIRFQPALLLILLGLFVVAIQANPGGASLTFLTDVIQVDELFAHLLFWAVVAAALEVLDAPSYRVIGFAATWYAAASIAWVILLGHASIVDTLLVMLATYALVIGILYASWFSARRRTDGGIPREGQLQGSASAGGGEDETPLMKTVVDTCQVMAGRYGLSPRETEVFILLAQGRTRAFIQDELVLSGSTVKTHVSHIYAKMDVHDRQEMMDLIWN
ncbi:MAG: helix-turn-helix transcriptional regulator [Gordonibacter sp.]|uniref:helix-turn-helix transcriptional regulator n=1 Tax=Gordonibacter sp. TaxID=1968902 RepID=UPI002FC9F7A0